MKGGVLLAILGIAMLIVGGPLVSTAAEEPATKPSAETRGPFLRVLGTAQDGGLPHAACSCSLCRRALEEPARQRLIASLALVVPASEQIYLFDATPDLRRQLVNLEDLRRPLTDRVDRQPLDGIFLTHAHIGHYLGLAFFGYEAIHTSDLRVFATHRMAAYLRSNGPWSQLVELGNIRLQELQASEAVRISSGLTVTPLRAPHRDEYADTLGFLIAGPQRTALYLPDTDSWVAWSTPITEVLAEVDVAMLDGTFYSADELPGRRVEEIGHPLIEQSMDLLQELVDTRGLEVYFTHLNHSNPALDPSSRERGRIETRGFRVLEEGQELPL